ncbi:MAG: permease [Victivallaceae bacterium]|nr:permease [Victivallaceae bacterium]MDD3703106.1 permease [Victivallaceae bacterium]MDD4316982.1 permease [Victivallaceae bacterium]
MWKTQWRPLAWLTGAFLICFYLPVGTARFNNAVLESLELVKWYAREHVLLCLIPAFFIAGAIGVFVSQGAVMRYLGPKAKKWLAYLVASVSGSILAVCSCTILPLFAGIYKMGAGLGPASAFLYSGPAINIMAIVLTARVLGIELGIARAAGAIGLSVVIGLCMHLIFRKEEAEKARLAANEPEVEAVRPLWQNIVFLGSMVAILVFANFGKSEDSGALWTSIWNVKWYLTSISALALGFMLTRYYGLKLWKLLIISIPVVALAILFPANPLLAFTAGFLGIGLFSSTEKNEELKSWFETSWDFAKKIMPLLLFGVLIAGLLLGRVGAEGLIPSEYVSKAVGGNSLVANFFASFAGAFMYFATLTEVPILEGLIGAGMGKGPALALLLAGPALSLPNMLVINGVMGFKKTAVFVLLVIFFSTLCGIVYGNI